MNRMSKPNRARKAAARQKAAAQIRGRTDPTKKPQGLACGLTENAIKLFAIARTQMREQARVD